MKILILTNTYPPYITGGYEIACYDIVQELNRKGYDIDILTSQYQCDPAGGYPQNNPVYRVLHLEREFYQYKPHYPLQRLVLQSINCRIFQRYLNKINPDIIFFWNFGALSFRILSIAEKIKPTVYYLSDTWLAYLPFEILFNNNKFYSLISFRRKIYSKIIGKCIPCPQNIICCSQALRDQYIRWGFPIEKAEIIYHGINPNYFYPEPYKNTDNSIIRILYSGRIIQIKGIETLIEAMNILINQKNIRNIRLTILGNGQPEYINELKEKTLKLSIENYIQWESFVDRDKLRDKYINHDILVFPSIWLEPFSLTILEAMASGLPIIATPTGGTAEILIDKENALLFQAGQASDLADKIESMSQSLELRHTIRENARQRVQSLTIQSMADKIDAFLQKIKKDSVF